MASHTKKFPSAAGFLIGSQEQTAFSVIFVLFLPCLFLTLCYAREKPFVPSWATMGPNRVEAGLGENYVKGRSKEVAVLDLTGNTSAVVRDHPSDGGYESGSSETEEMAPLVLPSSEMLWWRYQQFVRQLSRLPHLTLQWVVKGVLRFLWKLVIVALYLPYHVSEASEVNSPGSGYVSEIKILK